MIEITDRQWSAVSMVLPLEDQYWIGSRNAVAAILWKLHSERPWEEVPPHYGDTLALAELYTAWCEEAIWPHIFATLIQNASHELSENNWSV